MISRRPFSALLAAAILCLPVQVLAADALVLVAAQNSQISKLSSLEIRKLYLGFVVFDDDDRQMHALINASDDHLMDVFLQNVMAMSRRAYDRRLLTLTVQTGRTRPQVYTGLDDLQLALAADPLLVSCMWLSDVKQAGELKVVKLLWQE